jgi:hypothetical protein
VQRDGATSFVFVRLTPTSFQARKVTVGVQHDNVVEVSDVQLGEEVVTTGSFQLKAELFKDRIASAEQ